MPQNDTGHTVDDSGEGEKLDIQRKRNILNRRNLLRRAGAIGVTGVGFSSSASARNEDQEESSDVAVDDDGNPIEEQGPVDSTAVTTQEVNPTPAPDGTIRASEYQWVTPGAPATENEYRLRLADNGGVDISYNFKTAGDLTIDFHWRHHSGGSLAYMWNDLSSMSSGFRAFTNGIAYDGLYFRNVFGGSDIRASGNYQDGSWYHIRIVLDSGANTFTVYVDGNRVGRSYYNGSGFTTSDQFRVMGRASGSSTLIEYDRFVMLEEAIHPGEDVVSDLLHYELDDGTGTVVTNGTHLQIDVLDARLVQVVEDTRVVDRITDDVIYDGESDPDLITGRNGALVFDLETPVDENPGERPIPGEIDIDIVKEVSNPYGVTPPRIRLRETITLDRDEFIDVVTGDKQMVDVYEERSTEAPVLRVDDELYSVTIEVGTNADSIVSDDVSLELGSDYDLVDLPPLRVGFIAIEDAGSGDNYGDSNTGGPLEYEAVVEEAVEYLKQVYPTTSIQAYRHDYPISGTTTWSWSEFRSTPSSGYLFEEAFDAHGILDAIARSGLVDGSDSMGGEIVAGDAPIESFDETVLIVPGDDGNGHYFDYQGRSATGVHFHWSNRNRQTASASVALESGGLSWRSTRDAAETVAHELGHHFTEQPYEGPSSHQDPLAMRNGGPDFEHAKPRSMTDRERVISTGYDLEDGHFDIERDALTFMSYSSTEEWIDTRMYQLLIDGEFEPDPPIGSVLRDQLEELFAGTASIQEDGSVEFDRTTTTDGFRMDDFEEGSVQFEVIDVDGDVLESVGVSDQLIGQVHGESEINLTGTVPFWLTYPKTAVEIRATHEGNTTSIEPLSMSLRDAIRTLPDLAFDRRPRERRKSLLNKVAAFERQMKAEAFRGANRKLRKDIRRTVEQWLVEEYPHGANQRSKADVIDLIDGQIERTATLDETTGGGTERGGQGNGRGGGR